MWNPFKIYKYSKSVFESTGEERTDFIQDSNGEARLEEVQGLSLIHISEPTRPRLIS